MFYVNQEFAKIIMVDFLCENKIIEYDGDYWHKDKKDIDKKRDSFLKSKGYKILRILDSEYRKNKGIILNECINFLING